MTTNTVPNFLEDEDYDSSEASSSERISGADADVEPSSQSFRPAVQEANPASTAPKTGTVGAVTPPVDASESSLSAASASATRRNPAAPKYGRSRFTDKDALVLGFLRKFPLATSSVLGVLLNIKTASAHKRALALRELGLVGSEQVIGLSQLWFLTKRGHDLLEVRGYSDDRVPARHRPGSFNLSKIGHRLAVSHVAAQLLGGSSQIKKSGSISLPTGLELLPLLVPEPFMNSAYGSTSFRPEIAQTAAEVAWRKQEEIASEVAAQRLPLSEALESEPSLWTLTTDFLSRKTGRENHPVDLAIDLEEFRTSIEKPVSIGLEIELNSKSPSDLKAIIGTMKSQTEHGKLPVFGVYYYLTHDKRIAEAVLDTAEELGAKRLVKVLPFNDSTGQRYNGKAWTL